MTSESPPTTAMRLSAEPARIAAVRQVVRDQLSAWGREDLADAAALCVTEILANVHRHAGSPDCELTLDRLPEDGVRAAVSDRSRVLPVVMPRPDCSAECGRGMHLIAMTAHRWGTTLTPTGKQVWVVLR
ncbi:ATP-binding protein [Streptomyces sp. H10-C2]|uniref:ATP-binding protein n=1 Tax=unclassified Streptomyces TaxID=2593676 RepID=UPI0024BA81E4|nr:MULTISPECIES: ATP-binding protein [unclassified Streptomyces]MDJ0346985.1 ATP-binding protein [Streptomyces sp. PH10-H1]MDJ0375146.1 ATP-binding protein [Streptomyces sp. H10-C2]